MELQAGVTRTLRRSSERLEFDVTLSPQSVSNRIADEALDFVVLLLSGEATQDDAAEIAAWRGLGPSHEAAFRETVRVWRGLAEAARAMASGAAPPGWS